MSRTACPVAIAAALRRVEEEFGLTAPTWTTRNDEQRVFMDRYYGLLREDVPKIPEIESIAANSPKPINNFLAAKGFGIALGPFENETSIGVASVLDILAKWLREGKRTTVKHRDTQQAYPAVEIEAGGGTRFYSKPGHPHPIVHLATQTPGDSILITIGDQDVGFELYERIRAIADGQTGRTEYFDRVLFPMISLQQQEDLSWLKGITAPHSSGKPLVIVQALQENKMRMDEVGVQIQSAVAVEGTLKGISEPLVIDEPFYFCYLREGCKLPIFCAWLDIDAWKNPGGLG